MSLTCFHIKKFYSALADGGMNDNMYYGAGNLVFQKAEELRNLMTPAEAVLWKEIEINEWKLEFSRQHPIANWVVDFYCHALKLIVEVDGGIDEKEEVKRNDEERANYLKRMGLTVLRFKNEELLADKNTVLEKIAETIAGLRRAPLKNEAKKLLIIKIGGNIIDDETKLSSFLKDFAALEEMKILVHGGGKLATRMAEQLKIPQQIVDGRRITDGETLKIVTMVYAGYINKNIVARLQAEHCNALGLCGADGDSILAHKRQNPLMDYGFAGDIDAVNTGLISSLLEKNITPVFAPITHDQQGQLLNTNADTIAQELARGLSQDYDVTLIYTFEKAGVLLDINNESSVIKKLTRTYYDELKLHASGKPPATDGGRGANISAGMIPKLDNAFAALDSGVNKVIIGHAARLKELIAGTAGTTITHE